MEIEEYYSQLQFAVWVQLLITGSYLLIGMVPDNPIFKSYRKSRKIMGIAFFVYCLQFFLQWKFDAREHYPMVASGLNISFFYLATILLGFSFISLLKEKYFTTSRVIWAIMIWAMVSTIVWVSIFFLSEEISKWILIASALWLFIYVCHISWVFFGAYRNAVRKIQNYYSEDVDTFISWISKSVFCAIFMGLLCSGMAFAPKWLITIYLACSIPFFYYIFIRFIDYLVNYETVENAIDEESDLLSDEEIEIDHINKQMDANIQEWIQQKEFHRPKINLGDLAKQLNSNRSYLSNYINSNYSCTYYEWIRGLRIDEAKILLLKEPSLTITQIAQMVGFSSISHFTSSFTEKENITPTAYRNENKDQ